MTPAEEGYVLIQPGGSSGSTDSMGRKADGVTVYTRHSTHGSTPNSTRPMITKRKCTPPILRAYPRFPSPYLYSNKTIWRLSSKLDTAKISATYIFSCAGIFWGCEARQRCYCGFYAYSIMQAVTSLLFALTILVSAEVSRFTVKSAPHAILSSAFPSAHLLAYS
jgi:hypothetical protein